MKFLRGFLLLGILSGASLNVFPCKAVFISKDDNSTWKNILVSALLVVMNCVLGSLFSDISKFITFAGIFGGTMSAFTFPSIYAIKANYADSMEKKVPLYLFSFGTTLIGIIGTYYSLKAFLE